TFTIAAYDAAKIKEVGGHFWDYMQYLFGLRQMGCDVYCLEAFHTKGRTEQENSALATFRARTETFGLGGKVILYLTRSRAPLPELPSEYLMMRRTEAEAIYKRADLLLNFHYAISPALLACFRHTALVDIDPGLLQFWVSREQLSVPRHDFYFTIGENIASGAAPLSDYNAPGWTQIRPPICLGSWRFSFARKTTWRKKPNCRNAAGVSGNPARSQPHRNFTSNISSVRAASSAAPSHHT